MTPAAATLAGLHEAICRHPEDVDRRLVYADALDDAGRGERAEFIRVQCRIEEMKAEYDPKSPLPEGHPAHAEWGGLRRRERELLPPDGWGWGVPPLRHVLHCWSDGRHEPREADCAVATWRRGFVALVTLRLADWCGEQPREHVHRGRGEDMTRINNLLEQIRCQARPGHGPALVRAAPITEVRLTDLRAVRMRAGVLLDGQWSLVCQSNTPDLPFELRLTPEDRCSQEGVLMALSRACVAWGRKLAWGKEP